MKLLRQAIYTAMRDDGVTTVGLRTLLGHSATPWGVYFHFLPENPDFTSKAYVTFAFVGGTDVSSADVAAYLRESVVQVTAWGADPDKVEDALLRVRAVLCNLRKVTVPTSGIELHGLKWEGHGADLFDTDYGVYHRSETYRASYREEIVS